MMRFFLFVLLAVRSSQVYAQVPVKEPRLTFDTTEHNFGRIPEGPSAEYRFRFTNTGNAPLRILQCQTADPHIAYGPREIILPGKTGYVTVVMPTHGRGGFPFTKVAHVRFNAGSTNAPRGWGQDWAQLTIRGTIVPDTAAAH